MACWRRRTKAAISLKRVMTDEMLPWRAYRNARSKGIPSQPPTASSSTRLEFAAPAQNWNRYYRYITVKLWTANLADTFTGSIRTEAHEKFGRKGGVGASRDWQILSTPIISGMCKATNFKFYTRIHWVHPNKSPWKICEKRERGRIREGLTNFR